MLTRCTGVLLVLIGMLLTACASPVRDSGSARGFLFREIEAQGREFGHAVYVPRDHEADRAWPLVVFLHGMGECGEDGQRQLAVGLGPRVLWDPARYPAVILFPQKPTFQSQWEDYAEAVRAMIERTIEAYAIDEDRVYLTGLSQGGHGTWSINAAMPGRFAAIAPVCGYATFPEDWEDRGEWTVRREAPMFERIVDAAADVPVWAFHGEADEIVPPSHTEAVVEAIRARGGEARMTLYPGVGHNSWDRAYADEAFSA